MAAKPSEPKRLNRAVGVGEAMGGALDPVFRKRGFASRDIVTHWAAIAPPPYDKVTLPDKLAWPRGERGTEGAVLHLRVAPGHQLAVAHEGARIAAAINRYFGYLLVGQVRISPTPFTARSAPEHDAPTQPSAAGQARIAQQTLGVNDDGLRDALQKLGNAILAKAGK